MGTTPTNYWVCTNVKKQQCKARLVAMRDSNLIIKKRHKHTCEKKTERSPSPVIFSDDLENADESCVTGSNHSQEFPLCLRKSLNGKPILVDKDNFEYRMDRYPKKDAKVTRPTTYWHCVKKSKCKARVVTRGASNVIIKKTHKHTCKSEKSPSP